jgi:hypothetical protein
VVDTRSAWNAALQRCMSMLVVGAALLPGCRGSSGGSDADGGSGSTSGTESGSDGSGDSGGTVATATEPADCTIPAYDDDLRVDLAGAEAVAGASLALAVAGDIKLACGDGFVGSTSGSNIVLDGLCGGVAIDGSVAVAASSTGEVVLMAVDGSGALIETDRSQSAVTLAGVALDGDTVFVAATTDGVHSIPVLGDTLGTATPLGAATDARDVAVTEEGLLVADGDSGIKLLDPLTGSLIAELATGDVATRVVVDAERALVLKGPYDVDVVGFAGGTLSLEGSVAHEGVASDGVWIADDAFLVVTGSSISRFAVTDDEISPVSREPRPGYGDAAAPWLSAMGGAGDSVFAALGDEVVPVTVGTPGGAPILRVKESTLSMWADPGTETETVFRLNNYGASELILTDFAVADGSPVDGNMERPGCPGQYLVPVDKTMAISMFFTLADEATAVTEFSAITNDPGRAAFTHRVESNRPGPAIGSDVPDMELLTADGTLLAFSDLQGEVVLLKLFNRL